MRVWISIPIAIVLFTSSWYVYSNPDLVEDVIENVNNQSEDNNYIPLNFQTNERWLVLLVDFPDNPNTNFKNIDSAREMINGENGVSEYLLDVVNGQSKFIFDFHNVIIRASYSELDYGADSNGVRDAGNGLSGGASGLATEVLNQANGNGVDWSSYDLNSDNKVDRILILHTGNVQEDGGKSNEIWSHFGFLDEEIVFNQTIIQSYAMAGLISDVGTISHEVLHSYGAADLYAVHDDLPLDDWKGVGDFDIMASGNWAENQAGESRPVLPMASTMNLMGVQRFEEIYLDDLGSNTNHKFTISPMSSAGIAYRIEISTNEYVWMEYRHKSGVDIGLPGSGLLVSIEDQNVGNLTLNNVNRDSSNPYLMIVEADGNEDLVNGRGNGESTDLFRNSSKFGSEGIEIRDRYGTLVPWSINIENMTNEKIIFNITTSRLPQLLLKVVNNPVELLDGENFLISVHSNSDCELNAELFSDDNRILTFADSLSIGTYDLYGVWDKNKGSNSGTVFGIMKCGDVPQLNIKLGWKNIGNRISTTFFEGKIHFEERSQLEIPIKYEGNDSRRYQLEYTGPIERIIVSPLIVDLKPEENLILNVDPSGLLTPGMYARGYVVFHDEMYEHRIEIVVQSELIEGGSFLSNLLESPANLISLALALGGLWFILSMFEPRIKIKKKYNELDSTDEISSEFFDY